MNTSTTEKPRNPGGRPPKLSRTRKNLVRKGLASGISCAALSIFFDVGKSTIYRIRATMKSRGAT